MLISEWRTWLLALCSQFDSIPSNMDSDHHKDLGHGQLSSSWIKVIITIIFVLLASHYLCRSRKRLNVNISCNSCLRDMHCENRQAPLCFFYGRCLSLLQSWSAIHLNSVSSECRFAWGCHIQGGGRPRLSPPSHCLPRKLFRCVW